MKLTPKTHKDTPAESPVQSKSNNKTASWRKAVSEDSAVSDLSSSSSEDDEDESCSDGGGGGRTFDKSEEFELFEKSLRTKHSKACKAMSVRSSVLCTV